MSFTPDDERAMRRAIELTVHTPQRPFAAVIAHRPTGRIVAEGWNRSSENPIWHGEIAAINDLVSTRPGLDPAELVLYSTAEPCPMCQGAILWSGLGEVIHGTSIRSLIAFGWRQIDLPAAEVARRGAAWSCRVRGGLLEPQCDELFLNVARAAPGR